MTDVNDYFSNLMMRVCIGCIVVSCAGSVVSQSTSESQQRRELITSSTRQFSGGFRGDLERVVAAHRGVMGVSLKNLDTGEEVSINGDEIFPTASTIKVAVMCAAFDDFCSTSSRFKDYYETRTYDASTSTGGAGFIQNFKDGSKVELKELLHFMITVSDNVATNMVIEWLGFDTINGWLERNGFEHTRLFSMVGGRSVWSAEGRKTWGLGATTPNEMRRLMTMIRKGEAGVTSATDEMLRLLGHQYFDGGIAAEVPPWIYCGSKGGSVNESRSDNAIVSSPGGTYVLSVYTKDNEDKSWGKSNEAEKRISEISRIVWKHFNPKEEWTRPPGTEKF